MKPTVVGNASLSTFDAIVIGSGAGGGTVAWMLAKHGKKVLVIEAGPCWFDDLDNADRSPKPRFSSDELKLNYRSFIAPDSNLEPRTWRTSEADGERTFTGDVNTLPKTVGGGCVHADLKMPRFEPTDFQLGTLLAGKFPGTSFADWPVTYAMLEKFYVFAEVGLGVQGLDGADPNAGPRSAPYPMPPGLPMYISQKAIEGGKKLGITVFPYPSAVNSMPYDGRPACVDCGMCSGFGCPSNAKGSTAVTFLRKALLTGNCQLRAETRVVRLVMNGAKNAVTAVEVIGPDGKRQTIAADQFVLCASPIEDVRILLLSDPAGVGNSSGMVGRNLTFHFQTGAVGVFEERLHGHRGRTVSHGFTDFRGKPNDPQRPLSGIVEVSGSEGVIDEAGYYKRFFPVLGGYDGRLFKKLMRQSPGRDRIIALVIQAEDAPQVTNRVDLDPSVVDLDGLPVARITYANHDFELSASKFYQPKLIEFLGACGARFAAIAPKDDIPRSAHVMGTLRMGTDPKTSVLDPSGRFHDVGNLWAADGAPFPTSSGYNPTLTIVALAARIAAGMVFPNDPEKALST